MDEPVVGAGSSRCRHWDLGMLVLPLLLILPSVTVRAQEPVSAFVNVSVIPMDRERIVTGQTVVVQDGKIVAMGPAGHVRVPAGARRIDGQGKYLIPGLADMHAHVPGWSWLHATGLMTGQADSYRQQLAIPPDSSVMAYGGLTEMRRQLLLYLANGVTTIRIMFGLPEMLTLRAQAAAGVLLGPRLYVSSPPVYGGKYSPDSAKKLVVAAKAAGYDLIKMYNAGEAWDSTVTEARRVDMPIAGHLGGHRGTEVEDAIRAGYRSIEHLWPTEFAQYLMGDSHAPIALNDTSRARLQRLREAGVWVCPTLLHEEGESYDSLTVDSSSARYFTTTFREWWAGVSSGVSLPATGDQDRHVRNFEHLVKVLHEGGVGLLLGTDAFLRVIPSLAVHGELRALVHAGLTPYEALATGTRNVAEYLGTLDSTGTIAVGKRADLVLLAGNPLQDIGHTQHPVGVMIGGRWWARAELDQLRMLLEGTLTP